MNENQIAILATLLFLSDDEIECLYCEEKNENCGNCKRKEKE